MKIKGFDRMTIQHLGDLILDANNDSEKVRPFHRTLLQLSSLEDEAIAEFVRDVVSPLLGRLEVKDPNGVYRTMGFRPFDGAFQGGFALPIPGVPGFLATVEKRERVLPGVSLRNKVTERMNALRKKEVAGWEPTKKDWAQIRDDVEAEMLKTAPIRPGLINILVIPPYVYTFHASAKLVEECSALMRCAFGTWPVRDVMMPDDIIAQKLRDIVSSRICDPRDLHQFGCGTFAHMRSADGEDAKFKDVDIASDDAITTLLDSGYEVMALDTVVKMGEIGMNYARFRLNAKGQFSAITLDSEDEEYSAEYGDNFDYNRVIEMYSNDSDWVMGVISNMFILSTALENIRKSLVHAGLAFELEDEITPTPAEKIIAGLRELSKWAIKVSEKPVDDDDAVSEEQEDDTPDDYDPDLDDDEV